MNKQMMVTKVAQKIIELENRPISRNELQARSQGIFDHFAPIFMDTSDCEECRKNLLLRECAERREKSLERQLKDFQNLDTSRRIERLEEERAALRSRVQELEDQNEESAKRVKNWEEWAKKQFPSILCDDCA